MNKKRLIQEDCIQRQFPEDSFCHDRGRYQGTHSAIKVNMRLKKNWNWELCESNMGRTELRNSKNRWSNFAKQRNIIPNIIPVGLKWNKMAYIAISGQKMI